jgi:hypothetical protein
LKKKQALIISAMIAVSIISSALAFAIPDNSEPPTAFLEPFTGSALDLTKWTTFGNGSITLAAGIATIKNGTNTSGYDGSCNQTGIVSIQEFAIGHFVFVAKPSAIPPANIGETAWGLIDKLEGGINHIIFISLPTGVYVDVSDTAHTVNQQILFSNPTTFQTYRIIWTLDYVDIYLGDLNVFHTTIVPKVNMHIIAGAFGAQPHSTSVLQLDSISVGSYLAEQTTTVTWTLTNTASTTVTVTETSTLTNTASTTVTETSTLTKTKSTTVTEVSTVYTDTVTQVATSYSTIITAGTVTATATAYTYSTLYLTETRPTYLSTVYTTSTRTVESTQTATVTPTTTSYITQFLTYSTTVSATRTVASGTLIMTATATRTEIPAIAIGPSGFAMPVHIVAGLAGLAFGAIITTYYFYRGGGIPGRRRPRAPAPPAPSPPVPPSPFRGRPPPPIPQERIRVPPPREEKLDTPLQRLFEQLAPPKPKERAEPSKEMPKEAPKEPVKEAPPKPKEEKKE